MELKGCFPFRLGATSCVLPADMVANARFLAPRVDDIELVIFESDEIAPLPDAKTIETLRVIGEEHGITCTVHLPLDIRLGAAVDAVREQSVGKCLRAIERTALLCPFAYIVHCVGETDCDVETWRLNLETSFGTLTGAVSSRALCIETLDYPFSHVERLVDDRALSICLDIGHLARYGYPLRNHLEQYFERTRVVHCHGVIDGRDHCAVNAVDPGDLSALVARLSGGNSGERVLTLEVFSREKFEQSLAAMEGYAS